ncbi:tRNA lysidine(34) synthetase TilS [Streptococcus sp. DD12]|uniref:tRNA lysidine(34) synthetase TilS n=1 Tax=Streptococcus sp. DD12 TaxID=1777880 RepID=UPI0009EC6B06|nr:tRNA lysidine(34) synthetase TilS [Streptococcus sp. DD12]
MTKKGYFAAGDKVLVAVSGGQDSMVLLNILYRYQKQWGVTLGIAHVNHHQRPEADQEEAYLRDWAKEREVAFFVGHFKGQFSEARAREFRYAFFKRTMTDAGYTLLVTAHHKDDQAETVMMRLMRGGILRHLVGIQDKQTFGPGHILRPLLAFSKQDLPSVFHFEDSSNQSFDYFRNRVRHHFLPDWERENPHIKDWLVSYSQEIAGLYRLLDSVIDVSRTRDLAYFQAQDTILQTYLLERYLQSFPDLQLSRAQFQDLLHQLRSSKKYNHPLKSDYYLKKDARHFTISKIGLQTDSTLSPRVLKYQHKLLLDGVLISFGDKDMSGLPLYSQAEITIRHRQPGDVISFGAFSKKIRRLFIDEKISLEDREKAWVLEQENHILAVLVSDRIYLRKSPKGGIIQGKLKLER